MKRKPEDIFIVAVAPCGCFRGSVNQNCDGDRARADRASIVAKWITDGHKITGLAASLLLAVNNSCGECK